MEQAYIISHLKCISVPELLDVLAEAHAGHSMDIYEDLDPRLIDKTTDAMWEFIEAIRNVKVSSLSS